MNDFGNGARARNSRKDVRLISYPALNHLSYRGLREEQPAGVSPAGDMLTPRDRDIPKVDSRTLTRDREMMPSAEAGLPAGGAAGDVGRRLRGRIAGIGDDGGVGMFRGREDRVRHQPEASWRLRTTTGLPRPAPGAAWPSRSPHPGDDLDFAGDRGPSL